MDHHLKEPFRKIRTFNDVLVKQLRKVVNESDLNHFQRIDQLATRKEKLIEDLEDIQAIYDLKKTLKKSTLRTW